MQPAAADDRVVADAEQGGDSHRLGQGPPERVRSAEHRGLRCPGDAGFRARGERAREIVQRGRARLRDGKARRLLATEERQEGRIVGSEPLRERADPGRKLRRRSVENGSRSVCERLCRWHRPA